MISILIAVEKQYISFSKDNGCPPYQMWWIKRNPLC